MRAREFINEVEMSRRNFLRGAGAAAVAAVSPVQVTTMVNTFTKQAGGLTAIQTLAAMLKVATPRELWDMWDYAADSGILGDAVMRDEERAIVRTKWARENGIEAWHEFEEWCYEYDMSAEDEFEKITGRKLKLTQVRDILESQGTDLEEFFSNNDDVLEFITPEYLKDGRNRAALSKFTDIDQIAQQAKVAHPIRLAANAIAGLVRKLIPTQDAEIKGTDNATATTPLSLPAPSNANTLEPNLSKEKQKVPVNKKESDVDEGWKDWVAGAAIGAAALGGAGNADAANARPTTKPSIVQKAVTPTASQKELAKSVTGNPHEVYLKKAAQKAGIQGQELVAFLSQCAHETLDFKHMKEIGGKLDFKKYDPRFAPRKAKILGNTKPGDGAKYKGRGYIQITGKYNYEQAGKALGLDLVNHPELVEKPEIAAKVAVWYWKNRVANKVDSFKDTQDVTKKINPGLKHLDQRKDKQKAFQIAMR